MAQSTVFKLSRDNEYRRPTLVLDLDRDPYHDGCPIVLSVMEAFGHPTVYVEFSAEEAEDFATELNKLVHRARTSIKVLEVED